MKNYLIHIVLLSSTLFSIPLEYSGDSITAKAKEKGCAEYDPSFHDLESELLESSLLSNSLLSTVGAVDTMFSDHRIPMDSVGNGLPPFVINEPGSYYFTKDIMITASPNDPGITILTSNVTVDLNGYSLVGESFENTDYGILVGGTRNNITVKNGIIKGFANNGIGAFGGHRSTFKNIKSIGNEAHGFRVDEHCLLINCSASFNGFTGFQVDNGSVVVNCEAFGNEFRGIDVEDDCIVTNCKSFGNLADGFKTSSYSKIDNCVAYENHYNGFDPGQGSNVSNCKSYLNGRSGYSLSSGSVLKDSKASKNGFCIVNPFCLESNMPESLEASEIGLWGNGARCFSNVRVVNCTFSENDRAGIRVFSSDVQLEGNTLINNYNVGIYAPFSGNIFIGNVARGNGDNPDPTFVDEAMNVISGNYVFDAANAYGPIVNISAGGDISSVSNSNHPHANIEY